MLIFPSSETKTDRTSWPWASLFISALAIAGYLFVMGPEEKQYQAEKTLAEQRLFQIVEQDRNQGLLPEQIWLDFLANNSVIATHGNNEVFSINARKAWLKIAEIPVRRPRWN